jgi:Nickel/cobalt transporter regulator
MIMKKIILATLAAATVLTPIVAQAATVAPLSARVSLQNNDDASFQRGEGRREEGRRGEGRRGDREGRRGGENRGPRAQQDAQTPAPQVQNDRRRWSIERQERRQASQDGRYYDRNRDGNLDRRWDRNRDGNLDRSWDRNRDGNLDRRWDRNNDERLDRNWDRNRNGDLDRRYDRNNDNRLDRRYDHNRDGDIDRRWDRNNDNRVDRWNQGWRNDRRYDWRGHRDRYRSYYSPGRYYAPYRGHSYRRFGIGITIGSGFYGSRYWINDPWYYRLPAAHGPYRWVRYYDDVLLIDIRNGYVVDVIHNFFW